MPLTIALFVVIEDGASARTVTEVRGCRYVTKTALVYYVDTVETNNQRSGNYPGFTTFRTDT